MAELKTRKNTKSVEAFLKSIVDDGRRKDCREIARLMEKIVGDKPSMWGDSIVGFGSYRYKYASGREGDWLLTGFSPRKKDLTLYIMSDLGRYSDLLKELGKFKTGKSCMYVKRLQDIDLKVLEELIKKAIVDLSARYSG